MLKIYNLLFKFSSFKAPLYILHRGPKLSEMAPASVEEAGTGNAEKWQNSLFNCYFQLKINIRYVLKRTTYLEGLDRRQPNQETLEEQ
jgi:hypothetical protein